VKKDTVPFDLSGTLAYYYKMPEFADLLSGVSLRCKSIF